MKSEKSTLKKLNEEYEKNPIISHEKEPIVTVTTEDDIDKFHHALVQFCIDYINEHKLTDINEVRFNADSLITSCEHGYWTPATDSYLGLRGLSHEKLIHKNGEVTRMPYWYDIGESM